MIKKWFGVRKEWLFAVVVCFLVEVGFVALLFSIWNPDCDAPMSIKIFFTAADGILILIPIGIIWRSLDD